MAQTCTLSSQAPCPLSLLFPWTPQYVKALEATLWSLKHLNTLPYLWAWDFLQYRPHILATAVHLAKLAEIHSEVT